MTSNAPEPRLRHDPADTCFELTLENEVASLKYHHEDNTMVISHTFVPAGLRGTGVASRLVRGALDEARNQGWNVRSECSYVTSFLESHHDDYADLIG